MVHMSSPTVRTDGDQVVVESEVQGGVSGPLWYRLPARVSPSAEAAADALFPVGLIYAMMTDGVLRLDAPVSPSIVEHVDQIQDILLAWHGDELRRAEIDVQERSIEAKDEVSRSERTAACFTGGVDSFYSLLKNQSDVSSLVFVHGFDIPLTRQDAYDATAVHLREVARSAGKDLIEISTNLKPYSKPLSWSHITHGTALASIGMMLSAEYGTLVVPATRTYADLSPWGSHPLLDPLWSTEHVDIVHDGAEATRLQKVLALEDSELALNHLRVCWKNTGKYNCGVCEKCYRTKISLRLTGHPEKFVTFDPALDLKKVARTRISSTGRLSTAVEHRAYANEVGDIDLRDALDTSIRSYQKRLGGNVGMSKEDEVALRAENQDLQTRIKKVRSDRTRLRKEVRELRSEVAGLRGRKSVKAADRLGRAVRSLPGVKQKSS